MRLKTVIGLLVLSGVVFVVLNAVSYFVLSDFHGVGRVYDGMKRIGWPLLMFEEGGFVWRREFHLKAALGNLAAATCLACTLWVARGLVMRRGWSAREQEQ